MSEHKALLAEIARFIKAHGMAETTFGRKAANDGKFVGRLREGMDIRLSTAAKVRRYMADNKGGPQSKKSAA